MEIILEKYAIVTKIGEGGQGEVYLAKHINSEYGLEKKVVIKFFPKNDIVKKYFINEVKALSKMDHPNIITIIDAGETGEKYFLVLEYVDGLNLNDFCEQIKLKKIQINSTILISIAHKIFLALKHAHIENEISILHRDVSPQNILISRDFRVKLIDFGISQMPENKYSSRIKGKTKYLPESIINGKENYSSTTDIYSLAITLENSIAFFNSNNAPEIVELIALLKNFDNNYERINTVFLSIIESLKEDFSRSAENVFNEKIIVENTEISSGQNVSNKRTLPTLSELTYSISTKFSDRIKGMKQEIDNNKYYAFHLESGLQIYFSLTNNNLSKAECNISLLDTKDESKEFEIFKMISKCNFLNANFPLITFSHVKNELVTMAIVFDNPFYLLEYFDFFLTSISTLNNSDPMVAINKNNYNLNKSFLISQENTENHFSNIIETIKANPLLYNIDNINHPNKTLSAKMLLNSLEIPFLICLHDSKIFYNIVMFYPQLINSNLLSTVVSINIINSMTCFTHNSKICFEQNDDILISFNHFSLSPLNTHHLILDLLDICISLNFSLNESKNIPENKVLDKSNVTTLAFLEKLTEQQITRIEDEIDELKKTT